MGTHYIHTMSYVHTYLPFRHSPEGVDEGELRGQIWHLVNKLATLLHHSSHSLEQGKGRKTEREQGDKINYFVQADKFLFVETMIVYSALYVK